MEKNYKTKKEEMKNEKTAGNAVVFENPEFGKIRTLTDEDGEPLFCAKDVCDVLGYKKSYDAVKQLVNRLDTAKRGSKVPGSLRKDGTTSERFQQMLFVNESGFYALVLGSKLPTAVKFKNWVIFDVLLQLKHPNLRIFRGFCNMNLRIFVYFMEINLRIFVYFMEILSGTP